MIASRVVSSVAVACLAVAVLAGPQVISLAGESGTPAWVSELNQLAQYLGRAVSGEELGAIEATRTSGRPEIRALRAALLYRADPVKWASELSSNFSIHDYDERALGKTNDITQEDLLSRIKDLETRYPSLDQRLVLLIAFVQFRDANLWFQRGDQELSAARFTRGAFLAQVFKDSRLNAVSVAIQLDRDARQEYEQGAKGKR